MGLSPGTRLGAYEIVSPIGAGGMGEVYRARDTRLGREVAIKVLPAVLASDPERLKRFEREARSASALNHPNIVTIYDAGVSDSVSYIAMELVDGDPLRTVLIRGALPVRQLLQIGTQMAEGLAKAHAAGIVHRDLKPENVMLTEDGLVKILDFGLAKLTQPDTSGSGRTQAPTFSGATEEGVVLGTVAYMSPEQATGASIDYRSDQFSFGSILYEMATGRRAFVRGSAPETLTAIIREEPEPIGAISSGVPTPLRWIIERCLAKQPKSRYASTEDLARDLATLRDRLSEATSVVEAAAPSARPRLRPLWIKWVIAAAILFAFAIAGWRLRQRVSGRTSAPTQARQVTESLGLDLYPSFSPDGAQLAYCSDRGGGFEIFVRQLAPGGREIQITSDGQDNLQPAWSPDGREIAYASRAHSGVWLVPALGGSPRRLTEFGSRPAWSPDGAAIAFQSTGPTDVSASAPAAVPPSSLFLVPAAGGTPTPLTRTGSPDGGHGAPAFSPDGKSIVFVTWALNEGEIWRVSRFDGSLERIFARKQKRPGLRVYYEPVYSPRGDRIYFAATSGSWMNASLWTARLPSSAGEPWGEPERVTSAGPGSLRQIAISPRDGSSLAYAALSSVSNVWSLPIDVRSAVPAGDSIPLTRAAGCRNSNPVFSPDGSRISFVSCRAGASTDVWVMDADGRNARPLTDDPAGMGGTGWLPDGERIVFMSARDGAKALWSVTLSDRSERRLLPLDVEVSSARLSPDGRLVAFTSRAAGVLTVWVAPLEGGAPRQVTFDHEGAGYACWSPDGKFLAVELLRGPDMHIAIVPAAGGEPIIVTRERGLSWPYGWSPDGERIVFAGQRDGVWNVYWISRRGGPEHRLTGYTSRSSFVRYPAWSPRGNQIVYEYAETTGNIWLMDLPR